MFNQLEVIGNLGNDPEMRYTASGMSVTSFSVAVNDNFTKADGTKGQLTEWFRVSVFGKQGESCNEYLSKGSKVFVRGRLRHSKYTNRANESACSLEIVADLVRFLDRKADRNGQSDELASVAAATGHHYEEPENISEAPPVEQDELPF